MAGATVVIQTAASFVNATGGGTAFGPINIAGSITPLATFGVLASGNNTFAVPAGAAGCIITPPSGNTQALAFKTTAGDVGVSIPKASASMFIFDSTAVPANIIINAAGVTTGNTQIQFF